MSNIFKGLYQIGNGDEFLKYTFICIYIYVHIYIYIYIYILYIIYYILYMCMSIYYIYIYIYITSINHVLTCINMYTLRSFRYSL